METLLNLESFTLSAAEHSFSAAARRLSLTPAAVSRNVARLERNLGVRLFQRSTRRLTLTEAGGTFLQAIAGPLAGLQSAIAGAAEGRDRPSGVLRVSMPHSFGLEYVLPLLPGFLEAYPKIVPDWQLDDRQVDLVEERIDAAIGGALDLSSDIVARTLAPVHVIPVAAPSLLVRRSPVTMPEDLASLPGILVRSPRTGRIRRWVLRDASGSEAPVLLRETLVLNDPAASRSAAQLGLGVALLAMPDVLKDLESGVLVRLLPRWRIEAGSISLYYSSRTLLPSKTRAFVDYVTAAFAREGMAERFRAELRG